MKCKYKFIATELLSGKCRHIIIMFKSSKARGPKETKKSNINGAKSVGNEFEVDSLKERPNKNANLQRKKNEKIKKSTQTHRPGVGKFLSPLLVDSVTVLALHDAEPNVEGGKSHWGKTGLIHRDLRNNFGVNI